jgi:N-acetylneuraminic acid mutarotase
MSMPATLGGPGFGIINGHMYIAGGRNLANTNLNTLYDYDIAANTWTARANLPAGVNVPGSAVIGGKLWVFGGGNPFVGLEALPKSNKGVLFPDTTNILQIYDPATDSWSSGPTLNQQRSFPAGTDVGNTAVAVGGYTGSNTTTSVEVNVTGGGCPTPTPTPTCTPSWRTEPSIANARRNPATAVVGSNMYAITGFNAAPDYTAANESFNGTSWTTLAPIPIPHAQSRGAAVGTNIYVPGGFNSVSFGGPLDAMQIYNTTTNTWSSGMTLPAARSGVATAAFNGLVYVIAGYNPVGTGHTDVYIYNPGTNSYTTGAPMPAGAGNVAGVLFNGEIYVVGGGATPTGVSFAYNPTTNTWRTIPPLPTSGGACQSDNGFVLNNELWVVGCLGLAINQQVWIYNSGTNSWRAGPPYNVDHQGPGAAPFNGRGFVVGGGAAGGGSAAVESIGSCAPTVLSAVSRINHGTCGAFDIPMPLTCPTGVECRSQAGNVGNYTLVVTFSGNETVTSAAVTCHNPAGGTGTTGAVTGSGTPVITIPLTGVSDAQALTVHITGTTSVDIPFGLEIGDTNASRTVSGADIAQTKAQTGQTVTAANFREDVTANCAITGADVAIVKAKSGIAALPACCP